MLKKVMLSMVLAVLFVIITGCSIKSQEDSNQRKELEQLQEEKRVVQNDEENKTEEIKVDPIEEQISKMSLDEKIGQMVIVGFEGHTLDTEIKGMIEDGDIGGVILFKRNVEDSAQLIELVNSLKDANSKNNIPLFVSIDEEGGTVSRMPDGLLDIPTNRVIGQKDDKEFSYEIGKTIAKEIKSFGFNMNFAPVLDIDSNPNNPVIGNRSYGSDEKLVSKLGVETMKGIQSEGVISVVKHFPGHGDTAVDSHIGLPIVDKSLEQLQQFEFIPFAEAIKNNADVVMIAHILLKQIDPENPASFSKTLITDILRNQLNFQGVVITDDLTMGAIVENYDIGDAAIQSIAAGSDIALICHGYENEIKVLDRLKKAVENGIISQERVNESVYRILSLKKKYGFTDHKIDFVDIHQMNEDIKQVLNGL